MCSVHTHTCIPTHTPKERKIMKHSLQILLNYFSGPFLTWPWGDSASVSKSSTFSLHRWLGRHGSTSRQHISTKFKGHSGSCVSSPTAHLAYSCSLPRVVAASSLSPAADVHSFSAGTAGMAVCLCSLLQWTLDSHHSFNSELGVQPSVRLGGNRECPSSVGENSSA